MNGVSEGILMLAKDLPAVVQRQPTFFRKEVRTEDGNGMRGPELYDLVQDLQLAVKA